MLKNIFREAELKGPAEDDLVDDAYPEIADDEGYTVQIATRDGNRVFAVRQGFVLVEVIIVRNDGRMIFLVKDEKTMAENIRAFLPKGCEVSRRNFHFFLEKEEIPSEEFVRSMLANLDHAIVSN